VSGGVLLPKRVAKLNTGGATAGAVAGQVSAYAALGDIGGVVDEFLPAAGVANNDLFWLVVEGPTKVTTDSGGDTNIPIGKGVVVGGTGNGTVVEQDTTVAAGAATFNQVNGRVGMALEAVNAITTDFLIDVKRMG
jgi:hypothetical protein